MFSEIVAFECECASSDDEPSLRALAGGLTASVAALTGRPESIVCGSTCLSDAVVILCLPLTEIRAVLSGIRAMRLPLTA